MSWIQFKKEDVEGAETENNEKQEEKIGLKEEKEEKEGKGEELLKKIWKVIKMKLYKLKN